MTDQEIAQSFYKNWLYQESTSDGNWLFIKVDADVLEEFKHRGNADIKYNFDQQTAADKEMENNFARLEAEAECIAEGRVPFDEREAEQKYWYE